MSNVMAYGYRGNFTKKMKNLKLEVIDILLLMHMLRKGWRCGKELDFERAGR
jgi:hypothetical protein